MQPPGDIGEIFIINIVQVKDRFLLGKAGLKSPEEIPEGIARLGCPLSCVIGDDQQLVYTA